ncbi:unnamed protein product [Rhizophagus irregularis]|uniref:Uncharacterized protein n=1 Tax=Rhizophagus irregularis TaxID=588596 RepID=A0A916EK61_9GLOM|nr:hypothetical protein GLOIN_2v1769556 [Rhizophagus irregularis DAOM 181602=DAOM 197198]CAB4493685.1 unnamed protein product [Rhizophagus irregularis]CAB5394651.1 unnamed protein product [Rhizophagus irregularis]CAG8724087.1 1493_t:CDS:2 [Rhizophagus irregularis]
MPNPISDIETHGITITGQIGNVLLTPHLKMFMNSNSRRSLGDGSQEFCNILVSADEINSPNFESDKVKVDNNDPASVIEHVKRLIRTLRPDCELTDLLLKLWDLPKTIPNDPIKLPFKRDATHAMSLILGLGANNVIQDADKHYQIYGQYYFFY